MGGASSFYSMLAIAGFFTSIWLAGRMSRAIGISSIVLEVGLGLVLGPNVGKLLPYELSTCGYQQITDCSSEKSQRKIADEDTEYCDLGAYLKKNKYVADGKHWTTGFFGNVSSVTLGDHPYHLNGSHDHRRLAGGGNAGKTEYDTYGECLEEQCGYKLAIKCAETPDIFSLCGHIGVAMMIFESGMHFDFEQAKTVGPWACVIAVLGTFLPIIAGTGLSMAFGYPFMPDALSVGVSLAPTSVGIALKLLHEASALQTYFGQAVMTAAFVDDVLSLIIFSVLFSMRSGEITFMTFLPLILGCIFMVLAIVAAVTVWPAVIRWIFRMIPETKPDHKLTRHDEVWWILMFAVLAAYAQITHLCGTHLWGCFIAGMSFATFHHAHHVWVRQVKRITCWLLRIFFSCTLAWSIPVGDLFSLQAFWKGSVMGIGPCILMKVLCAPFMGEPKWVIGWAMVGRAEFAYFIAIMAKSLKMMDDKLFAILIWALIYATIFAPLIFRKVLRRYMVRQNAANGTDEKASVRAVSQQHPPTLSGHLPDLEQDELDEKAARETIRAAGLEGELATMKQACADMKLQKETAEAELEKMKNQETLQFKAKGFSI